MRAGQPARIAAVLVVGLVLGGAWGQFLRSRQALREAGAKRAQLQVTGLSCGPAALVAVGDAHDPATASRLAAVLEGDRRARDPVSSFRDLADWASRAGLQAIGLKIELADLARVPLPAIVHVEPRHFLVLVAMSADRAVIADQSGVTRGISLEDFGRSFTGHVLCFNPALERSGLGR